MEPKEKTVILSEDGRRFTVEDDEITGNESTGEGLAYEIDNPEDNEEDSKKLKKTPGTEQ